MMDWKVLLSRLNEPYHKGGRLSWEYNISKKEISALELKIETLINRERVKIGRNPLKRDRGLWKVANNHSYDMAKNHFYSHVNSRGQGAGERARSLGDNSNARVSENLMVIPLIRRKINFDEIAVDVVKSWKTSHGHWENAMNRSWIYGSIAIAYARNPLEKYKKFDDFDSEYIKRKYGSVNTLSTDLHIFFTHNFSDIRLSKNTWQEQNNDYGYGNKENSRKGIFNSYLFHRLKWTLKDLASLALAIGVIGGLLSL